MSNFFFIYQAIGSSSSESSGEGEDDYDDEDGALEMDSVAAATEDSTPAMIPYTMMNTGYDQNRSTDMLDGKVVNMDQVCSDGHIPRQESEPNDFKLDLDDEERQTQSPPAIILTEPSPIPTPVSGSTDDFLKSDSPQRAMSPDVIDENKLDDDKVGFYIGDNDSISSQSQKNTPKRNFYLGDEASLSTKKSGVSLTSSGTEVHDSESTSSKPQESNWLNILSDDGGEPLLSMSASQEGVKNSAGESSRVKFSMGKEISLDICMLYMEEFNEN